jgi:hypothetical protein
MRNRYGKMRFIRQQSGMLVCCHFGQDYKRDDEPQQGSTA